MAKSKKEVVKTALIDVESFIYATCIEQQVEVVDRETNEASYTLDLTVASEMMEEKVDEITREAGCHQAVLGFGMGRPFRCKIDPAYKAHRKSRKPLGYSKVAAYLKDRFTSLSQDGLEADDVLAIMHTDPDKPTDTVLCSIDKDLRSVPGAYYDPSEPTQGVIDIGEQEADMNFYVLALKGDTSDGFKGCPGVGEKTARAIMLEDREETMWERVVATFQSKGLKRQDALKSCQLARAARKCDLVNGNQHRPWQPPSRASGSSSARSTTSRKRGSSKTSGGGSKTSKKRSSRKKTAARRPRG